MVPRRMWPRSRFVSADREGGRSAKRRGAVKLRLIVVFLLLAGFVAAAVWASWSVDTENPKTIDKKMREAFEKQKYPDTEKYARRLLAMDPKSTAALLFAGQALIREERPLEALKYLEEVIDTETPEAAFCHLIAGQILCDQLCQFREGERHFRRAIQLQPSVTVGYQLLAGVVKLGTRTSELIPLELKPIEFKQINIETMEQICRNERVSPDLGVVLRGIKENPDDPNVLLGHASLLRAQQKYAEAEPLLRRAIEVAPDMTEPSVRLGQVLLELGDDAKFQKWQTTAKESLKEHPLFWMVQAAHARRAGQAPVAARCYWEAIKLDPNIQEANYQLGILLMQLNRKKDAAPFLDRSAKLVKYIELVHRNKLRAIELGGKGDVELAAQAMKASDELGNIWEVYGWVLMTLDLDKSNVALQQEQSQMETALKNVEHVRTVAQYNPAGKVDLASLPLPTWSDNAPSSRRPAPAPPRITFEDKAKEAGVAFQFFDGSDPEVHGLNKMFQINGGGTAAIDFDRDGWPDLYFTQGSENPADREQTEHLDKLFRNLGDGRFVDVTGRAGIVENGFSQGVAVGDVDNDGFPDIYVANIGNNRLFLNNGDGTFSDVTDESGAGDSHWTSSTAIADLNGDGLPDIYALGFVEGDALTRICNNRQKRLDGCMPIEFPGAKSHLWLNQGNGRFEDATTAAGMEPNQGKGVSLIAADFDGSRKVDLLVGNDGIQNDFFKSAITRPGERPRFFEQALASGLAFGADGFPHSTFGMATGDFNGDGLLDVYGTSFSEQSDSLYLQGPRGLFSDKARDAGLFESTYLTTNFGAQAIDADLDGNLDLLVVSGNVDNIHGEYLPYETPPSLFYNDGTAHFALVPHESIGPYFQGKYLGRSLARLDWNRDGREDVVISNVRSPAALLTNTTKSAGHHLTVRLVGTASARDAIGTVVELTCGKKKIVRQLTAGDGFQASNERSLVFGLGPKETADSVVIRWISGREQRLSAVPADRELLVVEGRTEPVVLRRH